METLRNILQDINDDYFKYNDSSDIEHFINIGKLDREVIKDNWLGYPPASEKAIKIREEYLGVSLPNSYKQFLSISNGFRDVSLFLNNLYPVEKIEWARLVEDEWWFDLLEQKEAHIADFNFLTDGKKQDSFDLGDYHLRSSLKISDWYDGMCVFLNPEIRFGNEWEVLVYSTWNTETERHESFQNFLIDTHKKNEDALKNKNCS